MDRLTSIRTFIIVAEHGRFRAASTRLKLSPAMVSKHIANLEEHLGQRLLNRNSRHVSVTEEGALYLNQARRIIDELDELDGLITNRAANIQGSIRLSAPVWMANPVFSNMLSTFMHKYPSVRLDIDLSGKRVNLIDEGYDLALRVGPNLDPGLIARVIGQVRFSLLAAPSYLAHAGVPKQWSDLTGHSLLAYSALTNPLELLFDPAADEPKIQMRVTMSSENETLLRLAAIDGQGLVFLPGWLASEDLANGALVKVMADQLNLTTNINAVFPSRRLMPSRVRAFIDHIAAAQLDA